MMIKTILHFQCAIRIFTWQRCVIVLKTEDGRIIVLVEDIDGNGCLGDVGHVRCLDTQRVLLLTFVIQRLSQRDFATESVDAEHSIGIAAVGKIVRQRRVRIDVVGCDRRNDSSHFGSCGPDGTLAEIHTNCFSKNVPSLTLTTLCGGNVG